MYVYDYGKLQILHGWSTVCAMLHSQKLFSVKINNRPRCIQYRSDCFMFVVHTLLQSETLAPSCSSRRTISV